MRLRDQIAVVSLALVVVLCGASPVGADTFEWDGDCALPTWWAQCSPGGILKSNWTQDPLRPGEADTVFIDLGSGVTRLGTSFTIKQCTVPGGLEIAGNDLTLTEGGSNITDLIKSGGRITLADGVTLVVFGISSFGGEFWGPGHFIVNGVVNFDGCQIENQATITLDSATGELFTQMSMTEDAFLEGNLGEFLHIFNGADIGGDGAEISDLYLTVGPTGVQTTYLDPDLMSVALEVGDDADVQVRSERFLLDSIFTIGTGSQVLIASTFGGTDRTLTAPDVSGGGFLAILVDLVIGDGVTFDLGDVAGETGGSRLENTTFDLQGSFTNQGRLRFFFGTLSGVGPFINAPGASAFTTSSGAGTSFVDVQNQGFFNVSSQFFINDAQFINTGELRFYVVSGGMSMEGTGTILNQGDFWMDGDFISNGTVACAFDNQPGGTVSAAKGNLRFTGDLANFGPGGTLTGGIWTATGDGKVWMPANAAIQTASAAAFELMNTGEIPGLSGLTELIGSSKLSLLDGASLVVSSASLLVEGGSQIEIDAGSSLDVQAPALFQNNSIVTIADGGQATFAQGLDLGDAQTVDSTIPELQGVVVLARPPVERGGAPTVTSTVLDNHGRVLPTERDAIGTMQLNGDYVQHLNGHLYIDVDDTGSDLLSIDGNATLDGKLELARVLGTDPVIGQPYTILTTTGAVAGEFDEVVTLDTVHVVYESDSVQVVYDLLGPAEVFSDGFESGDTTGWSATFP